MLKKQDITAVILAGGKGRRLAGTDKGLMTFNDHPLINHILNAIKPQVGGIVINANRNLDKYENLGYPVIRDDMDDFQGPLAGFAVAMQNADTEYIVTLPCDGPFIPDDYVQKLASALHEQQSELAVAHDGTRLQPVHALLPVNLLDSLMGFLQSGDRKIDRWYALHKMALADFSSSRETFTNINTPEEHERLQAEMKQLQ